MASKKTKSPNKKSTAPKPAESPHRKAAVFVSLIGVLTLTTGLLVALSPDPLNDANRGPTLLNADRTAARSATPLTDARTATNRPSR